MEIVFLYTFMTVISSVDPTHFYRTFENQSPLTASSYFLWTIFGIWHNICIWEFKMYNIYMNRSPVHHLPCKLLLMNIPTVHPYPHCKQLSYEHTSCSPSHFVTYHLGTRVHRPSVLYPPP